MKNEKPNIIGQAIKELKQHSDIMSNLSTHFEFDKEVIYFEYYAGVLYRIQNIFIKLQYRTSKLYDQIYNHICRKGKR